MFLQGGGGRGEFVDGSLERSAAVNSLTFSAFVLFRSIIALLHSNGFVFVLFYAKNVNESNFSLTKLSP